MTGPDRIFAIAWETDAGHGEWDVLNNAGTEYIRRDTAVLAALPEVQALIAAAYDVARQAAASEQVKAQGNIDDMARDGFGPKSALDIWTGRLVAAQEIKSAIHASTPSEAIAALAARDAAMQAKGMREAAGIAWALEDGDRWTRAAAQNAILARAEQIERDAK